MAQLHQAGRGWRGGRAQGYKVRDGANRGPLRCLRRAPGARVRRWSGAYGAAVLHEFGGAGFQAGGEEVNPLDWEASGAKAPEASVLGGATEEVADESAGHPC